MDALKDNPQMPGLSPDDFDYDLPEELIAQYPAEERSDALMMVLERASASIEHRSFVDIKEYLRAGDMLVLNDTSVIPARLVGTKPTGGKAEIFLVRPADGVGSIDAPIWLALAGASKGVREGLTISFEGGLSAKLLERDSGGLWRVEMKVSEDSPATLSEALMAAGSIPLPPYIRRPAEEIDSERYQTVFAASPGAVAAPTAGLHFTKNLLSEVEGMGVKVGFITLHTGPGTFRPVRAENIKDHRMDEEFFNIPEAVYQDILHTKESGGRVFGVGTTVTRALEASMVEGGGGMKAPKLTGKTRIFIYPGFKFKVVDALITNFHLPRSTLIMLVSALAGRELVLKAYKEAVERRYRFYSYGDCMLIV